MPQLEYGNFRTKTFQWGEVVVEVVAVSKTVIVALEKVVMGVVGSGSSDGNCHSSRHRGCSWSYVSTGISNMSCSGSVVISLGVVIKEAILVIEVVVKNEILWEVVMLEVVVL